MSATELLGAIHARGRRLLGRHFGIDTRSLAVFRIGLGSVLIIDLLLRARNLRTFYTDDGVLPVSLLAEQLPTLARISLHARSGEAWFQVLLFSVGLAGAFALLVGYRTRIATGVSLALLLSLHVRNPYLLDGGDALLQHLLFWSLFLPLGERWSVDARHRETTRERIATAGSVAIVSQVLLVYGVNAVLKLRSDPWMTGDAVRVILGLDRFAVFLGPLLRDLPVVPWFANWAWVGLLLASPLLVVLTGVGRTVLVGAFAGMHFGMSLTMSLGIFPVVSIVALVPLIPGDVWRVLGRIRPLRRLRAKIARPETHPLGVLPQWSLDRFAPRVRQMQTKIPTSEAVRLRAKLSQAIATLVLVGLVVVNATALGFVPVPTVADDTLSGEYSDARWTMFAPHPPASDRWYVASGELANGERVDAYDRRELQWERPDTGPRAYSTARMRKYVSNLRRYEQLRPSYADYLCTQWSRDHDRKLTTVSVYVVEAPSLATGGDSREKTKLVTASCGERA